MSPRAGSDGYHFSFNAAQASGTFDFTSTAAARSQNRGILVSTALHCTVQHCTIPYCTGLGAWGRVRTWRAGPMARGVAAPARRACRGIKHGAAPGRGYGAQRLL